MESNLSDDQLNAAFKELIVKFPKLERLPVDPPVAGQNYGLFSFKLLPKPVNGVYGFLKFRGAFATEKEWESHAKNLIRTVDSKHHIWPYQLGRWMPITVNEEFAQETLEVGQQDELNNVFNHQDTDDRKREAASVREVKSREQKLIEESRRKTTDNSSLEYFAQQVMKQQQLVQWLTQMRSRKHDLLKALQSSKEEIARLSVEHPEYVTEVDGKINAIKAEIGLPPDAPIDRPSVTTT